ncbi:hypothetical protein [Aureispira anguillae]|uniref:Tetratricopeptide repeat protein n=1 Tax=Aureispira anguillae TaxID=2864201 RepID=A0A916DQD9_9BACT|nr:hypothetical protein [Aureispira anguillae]BDS11109.1 hypothetical protein AsAng_0018200 [Aureispira anguillae]
MRIFLACFFLLFYMFCSNAQSDATRTAWNQAKELCNKNLYLEAKPYLLAVYSEMPRPLCCYWLALAYDLEEKRDSAIFYYQTCIKNSSKPQLAAWDKLIRAHLRQLDFETAYAVAWDAMQKYPGNQVLIEEFKEVCLWSYFVNHLKFNSKYLSSTQLHPEYTIKTITEQQLIIKNILNDKGQNLHVANRQYKGTYELWKCSYNNSKATIDIKFNLEDHDIDRQLAKQHLEAKEVYNNQQKPVHIRLGALIALLPISDKQMLDLLAADLEAIRFCVCTEVNTTTSKKIKKSCLKDRSEMIRATCEILDVFK